MTDRPSAAEARNFVEQIIDEDLDAGRVSGDIVLRFPPEPNGYLHIGHTRAIWLNFSLAEKYGGRCHLRFDDTNPETEDMEYVEAIQEDIRWLGYDWGEHLYFASDYFEKLYEYGRDLIRAGKAYVDSQNEAEIRETRGTVTEPGTNSPYRNRSVEENLQLFERMKNGEFGGGEHVLRGKIDMASPNMLMRDPLLFRIRHAEHYRRGAEWCIYPMYDMAHPLEDAIENITHSLCSLEFEVHRPLYDWLVDAVCDPPRPHQYEFARLNLDYTVMSKRRLLVLVKEGHVSGWDDPRMMTISGLRRRGFTPESIRRFNEMVGISKSDNRVEFSMLEYAIRDDLNEKAPRVMAVLRPLKVVITNFGDGGPEDRVEMLEASHWPHDIPKEGSRMVPFTRELFIERADFMEDAPRSFYRLRPGGEVRLRYGYIIRCDDVVKNDDGEVVELRCTYDPATKSGSGADGSRRVKGTIHWVSATEGIRREVRLYDRLFNVPDPDDVEEGQTFVDHLNPDSMEIIPDAVLEPGLADAEPETRVQFERQGYFFLDPVEAKRGRQVWNRTVTLRDTWAKQKANEEAREEAKRTSDDASGGEKAPPPESTFVRDPLANLDEAGIARAHGLASEHGLGIDDAAVLAESADVAEFYANAVSAAGTMDDAEGAIANWTIHELRPLMPDGGIAELSFGPADLARLAALHESGTLSSRMAREVLEEMLETGDAPDAIVERRGMQQISDEDALREIVAGVLNEFPDRVSAYQGGKTGLLGFFMGQVMQRTGGKANPQVVSGMLKDHLAGNAS
ncbi:MAG: glutamine--tRNA ligase/YqeY domain fusion protein [Rhodothermales bacterium]|nr:glutamine--tRNA ligase/YqeY domain fusion protein [Rhodothermales bacterium]